MSLRRQAELDLAFIIEDPIGGFGWTVVLERPGNGASIQLIAFSNDISQMIDPDTGQIVSGRLATVVFRTSSIAAQGFEIPVGVSDPTKQPWSVRFSDIADKSYRFKIKETNPDRALGLLVCILEAYE